PPPCRRTKPPCGNRQDNETDPLGRLAWGHLANVAQQTRVRRVPLLPPSRLLRAGTGASRGHRLWRRRIRGCIRGCMWRPLGRHPTTLSLLGVVRCWAAEQPSLLLLVGGPNPPVRRQQAAR